MGRTKAKCKKKVAHKQLSRILTKNEVSEQIWWIRTACYRTCLYLCSGPDGSKKQSSKKGVLIHETAASVNDGSVVAHCSRHLFILIHFVRFRFRISELKLTCRMTLIMSEHIFLGINGSSPGSSFLSPCAILFLYLSFSFCSSEAPSEGTIKTNIYS